MWYSTSSYRQRQQRRGQSLALSAMRIWNSSMRLNNSLKSSETQTGMSWMPPGILRACTLRSWELQKNWSGHRVMCPSHHYGPVLTKRNTFPPRRLYMIIKLWHRLHYGAVSGKWVERQCFNVHLWSALYHAFNWPLLKYKLIWCVQ